ncbi:DUF2007 domain-containing protein [Luteimonas wenzhouensis]|uniref:DUF2007 domain-containing protein n=1 Tax=Luteimonas wenzhouensis TaxID=2599615 RepID=A0A5C5U2X6_9GAMM|nr:DUF2007 domain-containing protein [Luteimonas wenzhouensis]TWT20733.1 DUF2007 domain-containing protein [Luteimonas wenzhouensis]
MRQVFSSARIENAQAVAKLLADQGIEVRLDNPRGLRSSIRGNFSYRDHHQPAPRATVWVIRSDDQPRARQLLREAGLLEASPANPSSFLPSVGHDARLRTQSPTRRARMRLGLLVLAAVALALWLNQFRNPGWDLPEPARTPAAAPAFDPALQPIAVDADAIHRIPTPPALAATLAAMELATVPAATLCLSLDGEEADTAALAVARAAGLDPQPSAACAGPGPWLRVAVDDYRTDGSGTGTVALATTRADTATTQRRLDVRRDGDEWQVADGR